MTIKKANLFITGANLQLAPSIFNHSHNQNLLAYAQKIFSTQNAIFHNNSPTDTNTDPDPKSSEFIFVELPSTPPKALTALTQPEDLTDFVEVGLKENPSHPPKPERTVTPQREITTTRTQQKESLSFETHKTKQNEGGGNCLFYSVIDSLDLNLTHKELRKRTYEYAKTNAQDPHLQQLLINDASEIAADMSSSCQDCLKAIENGNIPNFILNVLQIRESFSLAPLLKSFPDFFKPFNENRQLIDEIKQLFDTNNPTTKRSPQTFEEKKALLLAKKSEIINLLKRIDKRWIKIAFMNFSKPHLPKIKANIVDCMILDMQKNGAFGGQAALYSLSKLLQSSIYIFGQNPQKNTFQETTNFLHSTPNSPKIYLLLKYNHFEAILEKSKFQTSKQVASSAITKTLNILSTMPLDDLANEILAGLRITKKEAIDLLTNAENLNPSNDADKKNIQIIKSLTDILGI